MKKLKLSVLFIVIGAIVSSCGESSNKTETTETIIESEPTEDIEDDDEYSFIMPSALQINSIFQRSGAAFEDGVTNSFSNSSNYATKVKKLLNLGVYTSDLAFVVLNGQNQMAMDYLKAVKQLSDDVGMSSIFNSAPLLDRFEANIGDKDSIISIMAEIQEETDIYIRRSDQENLAMIIFAGAWSEGMYLGLSTVSEDQKEIMLARLLEQSMILKNINKGLEKQPYDTDEMNDVKERLKSLQSFFENIDGFDTKEMNFEDVDIDDATFEEMLSLITEIRNYITSI